jgi:hypothetical protein
MADFRNTTPFCVTTLPFAAWSCRDDDDGVTSEVLPVDSPVPCSRFQESALHAIYAQNLKRVKYIYVHLQVCTFLCLFRTIKY